MLCKQHRATVRTDQALWLGIFGGADEFDPARAQACRTRRRSRCGRCSASASSCEHQLAVLWRGTGRASSPPRCAHRPRSCRRHPPPPRRTQTHRARRRRGSAARRSAMRPRHIPARSNFAPPRTTRLECNQRHIMPRQQDEAAPRCSTCGAGGSESSRDADRRRGPGLRRTATGSCAAAIHRPCGASVLNTWRAIALNLRARDVLVGLGRVEQPAVIAMHDGVFAQQSRLAVDRRDAAPEIHGGHILRPAQLALGHALIDQPGRARHRARSGSPRPTRPPASVAYSEKIWVESLRPSRHRSRPPAVALPPAAGADAMRRRRPGSSAAD